MGEPTEIPTVQSHSSASRFLERMEPLLLEQEARYGLILGLAHSVARQPDFYGKNPPYFAIAEDSEGIAAAAMITPPYGVVVHSARTECRPGLTAIAHDLANAGWQVPTANGPEPVCTHFAAIWAEVANVKAEAAVRERAFELRQVIHPTYSPGHLRLATQADVELAAQWVFDFTEEALHLVDEPDLNAIRARVQMRIEQGTLCLWDHGEPVSLAGSSRPTPNGIAIGPVYTPPHLRGRGYASSCVAQLSQLLLDQGRSFVTLFTDLANPTSNRIYQAIGYRPVCDYTVYRFTQR